jgi:hypothetical protein
MLRRGTPFLSARQEFREFVCSKNGGLTAIAGKPKTALHYFMTALDIHLKNGRRVDVALAAQKVSLYLSLSLSLSL